MLIGEIPLSPTDRKVPDGLKYHVLDVWVPELDTMDKDKSAKCPVEMIMRPVRTLEKEGVTKVIRERAKESLGDERLSSWQIRQEARTGSELEDVREDGEEWGGFQD